MKTKPTKKTVSAPKSPPVDPYELLPPTQENLKPGRFYIPDGDYAIGVIAHVDEGAFTAIMLCGPHVEPGTPEGERLTNVKHISRLTIFDLADRLRPLAAAAEYRALPFRDGLRAFEVAEPLPVTCVGSDQAPDGRYRLSPQQCAERFGGTVAEWVAKWELVWGRRIDAIEKESA